MIVVDASVVLEVLRTPAGHRLTERLLAEDEALHAPHLLDVEVAQVFRRYERAGVLDSTRGLQALGDLAISPWPVIRTICFFPGFGSCTTT